MTNIPGTRTAAAALALRPPSWRSRIEPWAVHVVVWGWLLRYAVATDYMTGLSAARLSTTNTERGMAGIPVGSDILDLFGGPPVRRDGNTASWMVPMERSIGPLDHPEIAMKTINRPSQWTRRA